MRIIKRKRAPLNENLTNANSKSTEHENDSDSDTESEESDSNDHLKHKKPTNQHQNQHLNGHLLNQTNLINENHPYYRVDTNEPLTNPYYNTQQTYMYQQAIMMPPPPIPPIPSIAPIQNHILNVNQQISNFYQPANLDYQRFIAQQHQQNAVNMYKLNDISNSNRQQQHQHQQQQQQHHVQYNHNYLNNNANLDPKEVFNNLPKTNAVIDNLNTSNLINAKHSSYFCLTPASSTTSLHDINNQSNISNDSSLNNSNSINNNNNNNNKKLKTTTTTTTTNKKRQNVSIKPKVSNTDVVTNVDSLSTPTNHVNITIPESGKRKRGRPPKNSTIQAQTENLTPNNHTNTNLKYNKQLLKPTTSSNLQKCKLSDNLVQTTLINNTKPEVINYQQQIEQVQQIAIPIQQINRYEEPMPKTPMPNLNWANATDLWNLMRKKDLKFKKDYLYMNRHIGIEPQMRAILIDWLIEISYAYRLHRETLHLSLEYMDRFMTLCKQEMKVDRLQLIGMTSLFLASKVEEIYPPKLKELASHMENYSNNNEEAISQFELFMLKTLNWEISPVTANTWLMTYLQIAAINYHSYLSGELSINDLTKEHNTHIVMPLNVYKNSSCNPKEQINPNQQKFYLNNYLRSVTVLDLCLFDMESLRFSYSILAASAMYLMIAKTSNAVNLQLVSNLIQLCTGYKMIELDSCIKWMNTYADVCLEVLTDERITTVKQFSSVEADDWHNIQMYYQNLELLKEVQLRKTPSKFYSSLNQNMNNILTPPESSRKNQSSGVI